MASNEEKKELEIAISEIGKITPRYDRLCKSWVFSHPLYPVEYGGNSKEDVIENYPKYLLEFIRHRLKQNLNPSMEQRTKGKGGYRPGAGRPKGTTKEAKRRIYLPVDLADWITQQGHMEQVRRMMLRNNKSA